MQMRGTSFVCCRNHLATTARLLEASPPYATLHPRTIVEGPPCFTSSFRAAVMSVTGRCGSRLVVSSQCKGIAREGEKGQQALRPANRRCIPHEASGSGGKKIPALRRWLPAPSLSQYGILLADEMDAADNKSMQPFRQSFRRPTASTGVVGLDWVASRVPRSRRLFLGLHSTP